MCLTFPYRPFCLQTNQRQPLWYMFSNKVDAPLRPVVGGSCGKTSFVFDLSTMAEKSFLFNAFAYMEAMSSDRILVDARRENHRCWRSDWVWHVSIWWTCFINNAIANLHDSAKERQESVCVSFHLSFWSNEFHVNCVEDFSTVIQMLNQPFVKEGRWDMLVRTSRNKAQYTEASHSQ